MMNELEKISKDFGIIKLVQITKGDEYCIANGEERYINSSYIAGRDEIYLGIYENKELLIASFFHEIGHTLVNFINYKTVIDIEREAWKQGFDVAKKYGYNFSKETYEWADKQIETYK